MQGYLGEEDLESYAGTPFERFNSVEWAKLYIEKYGGIDGEHHKTWVLDQALRILMGTPVKLSVARWDNGHQEYRYNTGEPSEDYLKWVESRTAEGYEKNEGISP